MTFPEAMEALTKGREFMALLPNGPRLVMGERMRILDVRGAKPRRYVGKLADYVSIEWRVFTREQLMKMAQRAQVDSEG